MSMAVHVAPPSTVLSIAGALLGKFVPEGEDHLIARRTVRDGWCERRQVGHLGPLPAAVTRLEEPVLWRQGSSPPRAVVDPTQRK